MLIRKFAEEHFWSWKERMDAEENAVRQLLERRDAKGVRYDRR